MTDEGKPSRWEDLTFDKDGRLIDLNGPVEFAHVGPPPDITWIAVMDVPDAFGRRAATMTGHGPTYDLRLASNVFEDSGGWYVHLVGEDQWWDWLSIAENRRPQRPGKAVCWPTRYVWVERRTEKVPGTR
jgi:hypothetical protein